MNGLGLLEIHAPFLPQDRHSPFIRELTNPLGNTGYLALFEIVDGRTVLIGAVRHQREDDCH